MSVLMQSREIREVLSETSTERRVVPLKYSSVRRGLLLTSRAAR